MKKLYTLFIICTVFICTLSFCPVSAFQEDSFNSSQYEQIGSLALGHLLSDGQIDSLDFSNGSGDTGFLIALGKSIVTKDPSYALQYGLDWLKDEALSQLQSLNIWFSDNFPRLYDFFTGTTRFYTYNPMPLETRKAWTHLLKDRVETPDPVVPEPDINYLQYINLINGHNDYKLNKSSDFFMAHYSYPSSALDTDVYFEGDPNRFSFIRSEYTYSPTLNGSDLPITNFVDDTLQTHYSRSVYACDPITIYISGWDSNYVLTTSLLDPKKIFYNGYGTAYFDGNFTYYKTNNRWRIGYGRYTSYPTLPTFSYTGTLENCFIILALNFRNIDIYVNGDLWAVGSFDPDDSIIYPIGIPDNFEILNGVQGGYYYPPDSYWNLDGLVQIIKQAISEYGVISINDIAPLIVDINGVQAVRTTNVARTDYDNLISEQYSVYPDDTVLQVPNVVLDNGEIISFVATSSGSDLIPDDIMLVLCGGGILLLIGYMINRMLE